MLIFGLVVLAVPELCPFYADACAYERDALSLTVVTLHNSCTAIRARVANKHELLP